MPMLMVIGDINYRDGYMNQFHKIFLCLFMRRSLSQMSIKEENKRNDYLRFENISF